MNDIKAREGKNPIRGGSAQVRIFTRTFEEENMLSEIVSEATTALEKAHTAFTSLL